MDVEKLSLGNSCREWWYALVHYIHPLSYDLYFHYCWVFGQLSLTILMGKGREDEVLKDICFVLLVDCLILIV